MVKADIINKPRIIKLYFLPMLSPIKEELDTSTHFLFHVF
jgi:hypothetical protein